MGRNRPSEKTRGRGYWLWLHCQRHMRVHTGTGGEVCVVCNKPIEPNKHYVYVIPTKHSVHMSGCLSLYPRSVWVEGDTGTTDLPIAKAKTKAKQEEEYLVQTAVCEVLDEHRTIDEVCEEFDLDTTLLTEAVEQEKQRM